MEINFNDHHKVAYGISDGISSQSYGYTNRAIFSQLICCITGPNEYILSKLKEMVSEMENSNKPNQGRFVTYEGCMCEIITNVWDKVEINKKVNEDVESDFSRTVI